MNLNQLKKIGLHLAVWVGAFCAVLISPVILLYTVPVAVVAVSDIVHAGGAAIAAGLIASAATCLMLRQARSRAAAPATAA
jgi:hypothetical protein